MRGTWGGRRAAAQTSSTLSLSSKLTATLGDARARSGLSGNGGANIFPTQDISGSGLIIFLNAVTKFLKMNLGNKVCITAEFEGIADCGAELTVAGL